MIKNKNRGIYHRLILIYTLGALLNLSTSRDMTP